MLFRLEFEYPVTPTVQKTMSILYGYPETILVSKGHIPILWTQLLEKKNWLVTFHWIEKSSLVNQNQTVEACIQQIKGMEGVKDFSLVDYKNPMFPDIYKHYMESGKHTRKEFDDKMDELFGIFI